MEIPIVPKHIQKTTSKFAAISHQSQCILSVQSYYDYFVIKYGLPTSCRIAGEWCMV